MELGREVEPSTRGDITRVSLFVFKGRFFKLFVMFLV
jgi:hypothetical protein